MRKAIEQADPRTNTYMPLRSRVHRGFTLCST